MEHSNQQRNLVRCPGEHGVPDDHFIRALNWVTNKEDTGH